MIIYIDKNLGSSFSRVGEPIKQLHSWIIKALVVIKSKQSRPISLRKIIRSSFYSLQQPRMISQTPAKTLFVVLVIPISCWSQTNYVSLSKSSVFIDKTKLLRIFFSTENQRNFITCPRRFGKTTNLKMIKSFAQIELDRNHQLIEWKNTRANKIFEKLAIASYPRIVSRHLARYVVIYLDLNLERLNDPSSNSILERLNQKIENIYDEYRWVLNGDRDVATEDVEYMKKVFERILNDDEKQQYLYRLAKILYTALNGTKSIILVDDYDGPMTKQPFDETLDTTRYYQQLNKILSNAYAEGRSYVDYILITGTSSMTFYSDHSGHRIDSDVISHRAFLEDHPLVSFCGILEKELVPVLDRRGLRDIDRYQMKECYNGYVTRLKRRSVYNSYSVWQYLNGNECNATEYWMQRYRNRNDKFYPRVTNEDVARYWSIEQRDNAIFSFVYFSEFLNDISIPAHSDNRIETNSTFGKVYDENSYERFCQLMKFVSKFSSEEVREMARDRQTYLPVIRTFAFEHGYFTHSNVEGFYGIPNCEVKMEIIDRIEKLGPPKSYEY